MDLQNAAAFITIIGGLGSILGFLWGFFRNINRRFDMMERRFDAIDKRFDAIDKRFVDLETRLTSKITKIDHDLDIVKTVLVMKNVMPIELASKKEVA